MEKITSTPSTDLPHGLSEHIELQLAQSYRSLKALGCDYFYLMASDNRSKYRFCSHEDWMDIYYSEKFISHDPLKRIAESSSFIALPWSQISHKDREEKMTMCGRASYGLLNGLTITRELKGRKYIFALATESKEHDLARYLLLVKAEELQGCITHSINLFNKYLLSRTPPTMRGR